MRTSQSEGGIKYQFESPSNLCPISFLYFCIIKITSAKSQISNNSDKCPILECAMGVWSVFPSSVLNWINEAGPYYYACYLSINICAYVPVGLFCAGAIRHPTIGKWTTHFVKSRLQKAQNLKQKSNNKFNNWRYNRMEKRWSKMVKRAENESSQFALGFTLGE